MPSHMAGTMVAVGYAARNSSGWHGGSGGGNGEDYTYSGPNALGLQINPVGSDIRENEGYPDLMKLIRRHGISLPDPVLTEAVCQEQARRQIPFYMIKDALDFVAGEDGLRIMEQDVWMSSIYKPKGLDYETAMTMNRPAVKEMMKGLHRSRYETGFAAKDAMAVIESALTKDYPIFLEWLIGRGNAESLDKKLFNTQAGKMKEIRLEALEKIKEHFSGWQGYGFNPVMMGEPSGTGAERYVAGYQFCYIGALASFDSSTGELKVRRGILDYDFQKEPGEINVYPYEGAFAGKAAGSFDNPITGIESRPYKKIRALDAEVAEMETFYTSTLGLIGYVQGARD